MELTKYTAEGTVYFWPPISQALWDAAATSSRDRELALLPVDGTDLREVYRDKPLFFPKYDHNGLRAFTFYDQGNTVAITAHLASFLADWTDTGNEKPHPFDPKPVRSIGGRITGTGPGGEPNLWAIQDNRVVDLRLGEPDWLLYLIEANGKDLIQWLEHIDETEPYHVPDLDEAVGSISHELGVLCPGLGGALDVEALLDAQFDGVTDEAYEAMSDQIAGDPAAKGAWAIAIVAKTLGLAEAWSAHLADRAQQRRVKGDLNTFTVQAKVLTAPNRNEWDDDEDDE